MVMASLGFTPAREQDFWNQKTAESSTSTSGSLSGNEARKFYESLTIRNDDSGKPQHRQSKHYRKNVGAGISGSRTQRSRAHATMTRRNRSGEVVERVGTIARSDRGRGDHPGNSEQPTPSRFAELNGLKLLRCAQEGDLSAIKDLLSRGTDLNFQDSFFWTAMMCACWAGQRAVVRLLLQQGAAWVGVVNTQGRDAMDLARQAGHHGVVVELQSYGENIQHDAHPGSGGSSSNTQSRLCDVCGSHYSGSLSSHLSSTLHQFSLRRPPPTPYYCLPPSSASYKMMVGCGWDPATGLGPQGGGPVRPVPTVLKRDQKGLGYGPVKKAKVTHFLAKDPQAVRCPLEDGEQTGDRGTRKEVIRRQEEKDKTWERDFRASFYL